MSGTLEFVLQSARAVMASLALSYEVETGTSVNETELKMRDFRTRSVVWCTKALLGRVGRQDSTRTCPRRKEFTIRSSTDASSVGGVMVRRTSSGRPI